jgi:nucleotide-binding universal stress UspA family protein
MSAGGDAFAVRRILAAVDAAPASEAVLATAAQLASAFDAELIGIFVEDINLLRLAGLPFAREVSWSTAVELHLDYERMERTLRGRAAHAQQAVVNVTTQLKLRSSLQVVRGQIARELLRAAENVDLVILGKGRGTGGTRIGAVARQVLQQARRSVLLVAREPRHHEAVMTVYTGTGNHDRTVEAAARLALATDKTLLVLIPAANPEEYQRLLEQCRSSLAPAPPSVFCRRVNALEACFNQHLIHDEDVGLVVIDGTQAVSTAVETRLAGLECPVLLVR